MDGSASIKIPRGQKAWERWLDKDRKLTHIVTSDTERRRWYLYSVGADGALTKEKTGKTPSELRR